ncbi:hypothetical protein Tco_0302141, partial [Tanacetum coccineum]
VDKTFRFVEEPVEIMDRKIKSLKRSKISLVKVRWNSKGGPEFTWEREDYMKSKYPQLFVDRADDQKNRLVKSQDELKWFTYVHDVILEANDYLILCVYEFGVKYSIYSRVVIMEMKDVLHALLRQ